MAYKKTLKEGFVRFDNAGGVRISTSSGRIKVADGYAFRDLSGEAELLPYEDWRLSFEERAKDLAARMTPREMIGLTLHTAGQPLPSVPGKIADVGTYGGKPYGEDPNTKAWDLTDQQKDMLQKGVRHLVMSSVESVEAAARWTNGLNTLAESLPHGIPVNVSSDPRHGATAGFSAVEFNRSEAICSAWPESLPMAAAADPALARSYAKTVAKEYRAMGISTALGPQIDLASDPRWFRDSGTLGSDIELNIKLTQAICDGYQTTEGSETGWGKDSIIAMAKHWPGGGSGEGGRDAHYPFGKYAVYPGNNFETHLRSFLEGAFALPGKTKTCAAIMPYYTVSWNQDTKYGENVGNSFSTYIIKDLLIEKYGFEGLICTDWDVLSDKRPHVGMYVMGGKCYGVEDLPKEERVLKLLMNGVNQFGGQADREPVDAAYALGCERYGQETMDAVLSLCAYKALLNMFRLGLFDDPFLDVEESRAAVKSAEAVRAGYEAQLASPVLLKNRTVSAVPGAEAAAAADSAESRILPLKKGIRVYVPELHTNAHYSFVRMIAQGGDTDPLAGTDVSPYFTRVADPAEADCAIVFLRTPFNRNGYEFDMMKMRTKEPQPEMGYHPISLQYRPYTAEAARKVSIAGGDPNETDTNRSYYGKSEVSANEADLDALLGTREAMPDKPVIAVAVMDRPMVPAEWEPACDAVLGDFGVSREAVLDLLFGNAVPKGRLPMLMPASMETIERHCEDVPDDMEAYTDTEGNTWKIGFGM